MIVIIARFYIIILLTFLAMIVHYLIIFLSMGIISLISHLVQFCVSFCATIFYREFLSFFGLVTYWWLLYKAKFIKKFKYNIFIYSDWNSVPIFSSNKTQPANTIICFKCQNTGHIAKECPQKNTTAKPADNKLFCVICGKTNHLAIKCFQWKSSVKRTNYPQHNTKPYCTHCKRNNHDTANCRRLKSQQQTPPSGTQSSTTTNALND